MAKITSVKELVEELANFNLNVTEEKMTEVIKEALRDPGQSPHPKSQIVPVQIYWSAMVTFA